MTRNQKNLIVKIVRISMEINEKTKSFIHFCLLPDINGFGLCHYKSRYKREDDENNRVFMEYRGNETIQHLQHIYDYLSKVKEN